VVEFRFSFDGEGLGSGGTGTLYVDGAKVGEGRIERTLVFTFPTHSTFDVGADPRSTVTKEYPQHDNEFNGEIEWVRIDAGEGIEVPHEQKEEIELATQ
jgi:arylsulfatase